MPARRPSRALAGSCRWSRDTSQRVAAFGVVDDRERRDLRISPCAGLVRTRDPNHISLPGWQRTPADSSGAALATRLAVPRAGGLISMTSWSSDGAENARSSTVYVRAFGSANAARESRSAPAHPAASGDFERSLR